MKKLDDKLYKAITLLKYFIHDKNDFLIGSLDLYIYLKFDFEDLFTYWFFNKNNPSLEIFISSKNIKFLIDENLYGIPIFPPFNTPYYKLYEKIIDIYGSVKLDIIILDDYKYNLIKKKTDLFGNLLLLNLPYYFENISNLLDFKLKNLDNNITYDFKEIYGIKIRTKIHLLNGYLYNFYKTYDSFVLELYKKLDTFFGRKFIFSPGNLNKLDYTGIARFLIDDKLGISTNIINYFNKGDIIISNNTNVSYMKYFVISGGIVTVNNNLLSHACLISRELNLPLVLGAENLFLKIFDGDKICINSSTGEINILKRFWE